MDDVVGACPSPSLSHSDADAMEIGAVIDAGGLVLAEGIGQDGFDLILATLPVAMVACQGCQSWVTDSRYGALLWASTAPVLHLESGWIRVRVG